MFVVAWETFTADGSEVAVCEAASTVEEARQLIEEWMQDLRDDDTERAHAFQIMPFASVTRDEDGTLRGSFAEPEPAE